jgi:hypothetical protein
MLAKSLEYYLQASRGMESYEDRPFLLRFLVIEGGGAMTIEGRTHTYPTLPSHLPSACSSLVRRAKLGAIKLTSAILA